MIVIMYFKRLKCLFRRKENIFWSAMFPIFLSFVFSLAFSNVDKVEKYETIDIAIVTDTVNSQILNTAKDVTFSGNDKMFYVHQTSEEQAKEMLKEGDISGYIVEEDGIQLYLSGSNMDTTILKSFVDHYLQTMKSIENVAKTNPEKVQILIDNSMKNTEYINDLNKTSRTPKWTVIYYYALLSLGCLYGANFGINEISDIQANKSAKAARINVAPIHKLKLLICNLCAAITVQVLCILVALGFMTKVLNINFGERVGYVILTCVVGSICGVFFGAMLRAAIKKNEKTVEAITNSVVLFLSFLSGLMDPTVKYIVADKVPFLAKVNPSTLITDSFYCLYYYDSMDKYWINIISMVVLTAIFAGITYLVTRRRQYASI